MADDKPGAPAGPGAAAPKQTTAKDDPKLVAYRSFLEAQTDKKSIENSLLISLIVFGAFLFITFPTIVQQMQGLERKDDVIEMVKRTIILPPEQEQQPIREVQKETRQREFSQIPALSRPTGQEDIVEDIDLNLEVLDEMTDMSWDLDAVQAPGPILVAGDITPPEFIRRGTPPYPQKARILRRTGNVKIEVIIAKDGTLEEITVLEENPPDFDFGKAAIEYLKQCEWTPAMQNGRPIYSRHIFIFNFTL